MLQRTSRTRLLNVHLRRKNIQEQDIFRLEFRLRGGIKEVCRKPSLAFDGDQIDPRIAAQVNLLKRLANQRGFRLHADAKFPAGELILFNPVEQADLLDIVRTSGLLRGQPAAGEEHVEDPENQDRNAKRRETEKAEAGRASADELAVDDKVRRGCDESHHPADQCRHRDRHHELAGRCTGALRDPQGHRNENRHDTGRAHEGAKRGDNRHQKRDQPRFALAGGFDEPIAETLRDACADEALANDEQRAEKNNIRITEPGKRLAHRDNAGERQNRQHDQTHGVHPRLVHREHHDGNRQQTENDGELLVHEFFVNPTTCTETSIRSKALAGPFQEPENGEAS